MRVEQDATAPPSTNNRSTQEAEHTIAYPSRLIYYLNEESESTYHNLNTQAKIPGQQGQVSMCIIVSDKNNWCKFNYIVFWYQCSSCTRDVKVRNLGLEILNLDDCSIFFPLGRICLLSVCQLTAANLLGKLHDAKHSLLQHCTAKRVANLCLCDPRFCVSLAVLIYQMEFLSKNTSSCSLL